MQQSRRKENTEGKLIAPQAPGLTLKYLLTGLIRCGHCNASLRPVPSGRKSKAGRRYVYYACPRHYDGACNNSRHVPEDRLRRAVITRLRSKLFPLPIPAAELPSWLPALVESVRQELQRVRDESARSRCRRTGGDSAVGATTRRLVRDLGQPSIADHGPVRHRNSLCRRQTTASIAAAGDPGATAAQERVDRRIEVPAIIEALRQLGEVLARHNPTLANLELAKHIDVIVAFSNGRVEMRGTVLGLFHGAVDVLGQGEHGKGNERKEGNGGHAAVLPRRRARLHVPTLSGANPIRTEGRPARDFTSIDALPEPFVWEESIDMAAAGCWSETHAAEVARMRATGKTHQELADHFKVSVPTGKRNLAPRSLGKEDRMQDAS